MEDLGPSNLKIIASLGGRVDDPFLSSSKPHPRSTKTGDFFMEIPRENDAFSLLTEILIKAIKKV
ncbi:hypothetical protein HispidOSU_004547 [Sigmodon hispidus]